MHDDLLVFHQAFRRLIVGVIQLLYKDQTPRSFPIFTAAVYGTVNKSLFETPSARPRDHATGVLPDLTGRWSAAPPPPQL